MKLTEAKLKQLIFEVMSEVEDYYDPKFTPPSKKRAGIAQAQKKQAENPLRDRPIAIKTVGDFFKSMDFYESQYSSSKAIKSLLQFGAGFIPFVGGATHSDDFADGLANMIKSINKDGAPNLTMEEPNFPLLAFIDLDPEIEENFPTLISKWLKQINDQLSGMGLSESSAMPNADDLFLDWVQTTKWGCIADNAKKSISGANEDYESARRSFQVSQKDKTAMQSVDLLDKIPGYRDMLKIAKDALRKKES